ncbi:MAG TPA: flagellin [Xanthobacteraceae bacterium]|nr:flagellin [Xanthobacteraceae bacterium]
MSDIVLTAGVRQNLLSLQNTASLLNQTQDRLATGRKVNSALDNPISYFTAQALNGRANDLSGLLDAASNAVQTVQAANQGITSIQKLVDSAKSLANQALASSDTTTRSGLATQFNALLTQIDQLAGDSGYNGINLLNGDNLTVNFNENGSSSLTISGVTDKTANALNIAGAAGSWATNANVNTALTALNTATTTLSSQAAQFGSTLTVVQTRQDFTKNLINTLQTGADNLTLADTNLEGANLTALQTRQQLSIVALSLASQSNQAVLRLFG